MANVIQTADFILSPADNRRLAAVCGQFDENLDQIETYFNVEIHRHNNAFQVSGDEHTVAKVGDVLTALYDQTATNESITPESIHFLLKGIDNQTNENNDKSTPDFNQATIKTLHLLVKPRSLNQYEYVKDIAKHDINFAIGPAGTGKTYLAVACAVAALEKEQVRRIILVRPAVEAGENLGFLPGDLIQKVEPYLRPLYDALYEMLGIELVNRYIERNIIEIAPLAFMRGRTLNDAFIILDESQNTTREQMQMFLTRMGFGSKSVITGDVTQIDLPKRVKSGLVDASEVLKGTADISFTYFDSTDVVRHPLVQRIIECYEKQDKSKS